MAQVIDFDAFRQEQKSEPIILKVGGVEYELSAGLPASIALDILRLRHDKAERDIQPDELEGMSRGVFGDELHELLVGKHHLSLDELGELMKQTLELYSPGGPAPNRARRRARPAQRKRSTSRS